MVSNFSVDSAVATAREISSITPFAASSASIYSPSSGFSSICCIFMSYSIYHHRLAYIFLLGDCAQTEPMLNEEFLELVPLELTAQLQDEAILLLPRLVPLIDAFEDALHDVDL